MGLFIRTGKAIYGILLICLTLAAPHAMAKGGGSDGGGDQIVSDFVRRGIELVRDNRFSEKHRNLLKVGLKAKIVTTQMLLNPAGGAVPEQERLIAYSYKGNIQLKLGLSSLDSWEQRYLLNYKMDHMIVHELFRASGALDSDGKSVDEGFRLSVGIYGLDQARGSLNASFFLRMAQEFRQMAKNICSPASRASKHELSKTSTASCEAVALLEEQVLYNLYFGRTSEAEKALNALEKEKASLCSDMIAIPQIKQICSETLHRSNVMAALKSYNKEKAAQAVQELEIISAGVQLDIPRAELRDFLKYSLLWLTLANEVAGTL